MIKNERRFFDPKIELFVILAFFLTLSIQQQCHYSCNNCTTSFYTSCLACSDSQNTLTVLEDPNYTNPIYRHSIYQSGICTAKVPQGINGLGIFLLVISIGGLLITQSHQAFYICSTLQTLSLFGLLEVAWLQPASFIFQAFEYFMPINLILSSSKTDDSTLFLFGFYRLDQYMVSSQDIGLIAVFAIDSVLFVLIFTIFLITLFRRRKTTQQQQKAKFDENGNNLIPELSNFSQKDSSEIKQIKNKEHLKTQSDIILPEDNRQKTCKDRLAQVLCDKFAECLILRKIMHITIYLFFFFVQQTALSIMVGAVFDISTLDVAIWIVFFVEIVTILVISIYEHEVDRQLNPSTKETQQFGLSLFLSRQCMFLVLVKKVILPLGIVIPPNVQYIYFALYLLLFLIEGTLDARSGRVQCLSRITLWKIFQMFVTTLVLTFYFNQRKGSSTSNAGLITIILTVTLLVFIVSLVIQFVVSFVFLFLAITKVHNEFDESPQNNYGLSVKNDKLLQMNNTEIALNEPERVERNIFESIQMTRQNTKNRRNQSTNNNSKRNGNKQVVHVEQFSDYEKDQVKRSTKNNNNLVVTKAKTNDLSGKLKVKQIQSKVARENKQILKDFNGEEIQKDNDDAHDENGQTKKPKRRRIEDPQLRKRYGIK